MKSQSMTLGQLKFLMDATEVERFHTKRTIFNQTIGEHSFGVAWFCYFLTGGHPSPDLLTAALKHDMGEFKTGDIPAPTKLRFGPEFRQQLVNMEENEIFTGLGVVHAVLSADEERWLKMADAMEGMLFCIREERLGNTRLRASYDHWMTTLAKFTPFSPNEERLVGALNILKRDEVAP